MFQVGDLVEKFTGDYRAPGEVRAVFTVWDGGPVRYVVRHKAEGGGHFCYTSTARPICAKLLLRAGRKATRRLMRKGYDHDRAAAHADGADRRLCGGRLVVQGLTVNRVRAR